jgi:hypothetical protein
VRSSLTVIPIHDRHAHTIGDGARAGKPQGAARPGSTGVPSNAVDCRDPAAAVEFAPSTFPGKMTL